MVRAANRAHVRIFRRVVFQRLHNARLFPGGRVVRRGLLGEIELLVAHVVCGHGGMIATGGVRVEPCQATPIVWPGSGTTACSRPTATDTFGVRFATTNAGLLYTAKGTAALLVPYASSIHKMTGSWDLVFIIAAGANIAAAVLAVAVLKPWRTRVIRRSSEQIETSPEMAPRPA